MEVEQGQGNDGNGLSGVLGMSRAEFRYLIASVVGGAVHGLRAELGRSEHGISTKGQSSFHPSRDPKHVNPRAWRGNARLNLGDYQGAVADCTKAPRGRRSGYLSLVALEEMQPKGLYRNICRLAQ